MSAFGLALGLPFFGRGGGGSDEPELIYSDNFDSYADGAAVTGWTNIGTASFRARAFDPVSGANSFGETSAGGTAGDTAIYTAMTAVADMSVQMSQEIHLDGSSLGRNVGIILRSDDAAANGYYVLPNFSQTGTNPNSILIFKKVSGSFTQLDVWRYFKTFINGDIAHFKASIYLNEIRWKVWKNLETEPDYWMGSWSDASVEGTGKIGLYIGINSTGSASNASVDDILVETAVYDPIENWWEVSGVTNCVAAYQARGAISQAGSYTNLANPGTNDLTVGNAPAWTASLGWNFDGTNDYLLTGIVPGQTYTMIVQFTGAAAAAGVSRIACGIDAATNTRFYLWPAFDSNNQKVYASGNLAIVATRATQGTLAIAGQQGYAQGVADGAAIGAFSGAPTKSILIGCATETGNNNPSAYFDGEIQAWAIFSGTLTPTQILAVSQRMNSLGNIATEIPGTASGVNTMLLQPVGHERGSSTPIIMYHHGVGEDEGCLTDDALKQTCVVALLRAGYVLGCSASGGNNWGNQAAQDDYAAFYTAIDTRYSISRLSFWSQSMGGMSGLLCLRDVRFPNVKGWLGTYPVTNLADMYDGGAGTYEAQIETAYGFADPTGYAAATAGFDPNLLSSAGYLVERTRFYASAADTVVDSTQNTDLMEVIFDSTPGILENVLVVCSGDHGHASHFVPADYVDFFDRCV